MAGWFMLAGGARLPPTREDLQVMRFAFTMPADPAGLLALILPFVLLAGCASTPQATGERDAEAKQFASHPATAAIYVYRDDWDALNGDSVLYVGNRLIGATLPGTYFRIDVPPGRHLLRGFGFDAGQLELDVRSGEIYLVSLNVLHGGSRFALKNGEAGRRELRACCARLENWAPGQRPLLR